MRHFNLKIFGGVQGVSFRYYTRQKANELGVAGFIRNEADDSVYIEAEGEEPALAEFLNWCRAGPPSAQVERVEFEESPIKGFSEFMITK